MSATTEEYVTERGFPHFVAAFERDNAQGIDVPLYLVLLSGHKTKETRIVFDVICQCATQAPNADNEIQALLQEVNWRSHLVGAVALLVKPEWANDGNLSALWAAIDCGSWVSPQLAAAAFLRDPVFEKRARSRFESGCPVNTECLSGLDWAAHHSAAGPGSFAHHFGKTLAALVALCRKLPYATDAGFWLTQALADEAILASLATDIDDGGRIAGCWLDAVRAILGIVDASTDKDTV